MKKEIKKSLGLFFLGIIICVFSVFLSNYSAYAKNKSSSKNNNENSDAEYYYKNEKTGYEAYIFDESDPGLLTEKEKEKLLDDIKGVTTYGNVIFYSNDNSDYEGSAKKRYTKYFGEESGTIFAINMNKRKITLWSYGDVLDVISKGRSDVIVSNTYSYATKKKYYKYTLVLDLDETLIYLMPNNIYLSEDGKIGEKKKQGRTCYLGDN